MRLKTPESRRDEEPTSRSTCCNSIALDQEQRSCTMAANVRATARLTIMRRRFRALIAFLAIGLQGIDALVGAWGHSHGHEAPCCESDECQHHPGHCSSHDHPAAPANGDEPRSSRQSPDSDPHGDCTLCRHFSQPAAPVDATLELLGGQRIEAHLPTLAPRLRAALKAAHPARGPPNCFA